MANWCENRFVIYGETGMLLKFYMDMSAAISDHPNFHPVDNSWNRDWLGNLFLQAGYTENEVTNGSNIQCRGSVEELTWDKDHVTLYSETAWSPNDESMQMLLDEKYPGLQMVFMAEEPGCDIFINTDEEGRWIPEKFMIDSYGWPGAKDECEYFNDEDELIAEIAKLTGKTVEDIQKAHDKCAVGDFDWTEWARGVFHLSEDDDCYMGVHEFTLA